MMNCLLTPNQAAEFLGVSIHTIYSWSSAKKIPHLKIGGKLRFAEQELWKWVQGHIVETVEKR
jgi:excisionase family DNA binding protein